MSEVIIRRVKRGATHYATELSPPLYGTREEKGSVVRFRVESNKRSIARLTTRRQDAVPFPREVGEQVAATMAAMDDPNTGEITLIPAD